MHGTDRRQLWVWTAIIAAALVLLIVVVISTRSRPVETETVVQQAPVETPTTTQPLPAAPAPAAEPAEPVPPAAPGKAVPPGPDTRVAGQRETSPAEPPRSPATAPGRPGGDVTIVPARPPATGGAAARQPAARTFENTGLPARITYDGQEWAALERIEGLPSTLLEADEQKVNGLTIYHDRNAEPPFAHVYIPVAGKTDQYVRYGPAGL